MGAIESLVDVVCALLFPREGGMFCGGQMEDIDGPQKRLKWLGEGEMEEIAELDV